MDRSYLAELADKKSVFGNNGKDANQGEILDNAGKVANINPSVSG